MTFSSCGPATLPQHELVMHQFPVNDWPSVDNVKNVPEGHTAKGGWPSRDSSTFVGLVPTIPTVTRAVLPCNGRFGAPATARDKSATLSVTAVVSVAPVA